MDTVILSLTLQHVHEYTHYCVCLYDKYFHLSQTNQAMQYQWLSLVTPKWQ